MSGREVSVKLPHNPRLGRPAKYDWDTLTDGGERVLKEGDDFDCTAESMVILIRRTAKVRRLAVNVSRYSEGDEAFVRVQFYKAEACNASAV